MINYIEHKNINKQKWDVCVNESTNASIFVYSWYLDIVSENWSALVLNDYEAVFPLASKSKYKINYIIQPFFTRYFGVYSKHIVSEKLTSDFFSSIPEKFKFIEFCIHESTPIIKNDFALQEKKYQILDLDKKYESIQKEFSDNAKRNVKKAIKAGLTIQPGISPEKIVNLFKTTKGNELEVFKPEHYKTLIKLMNECLKQNKGQSIAVYDENTLCAAGFFMKSNNRFVFLKSGVTNEGKSKGAMHFLFDHLIKENADQGYQLDFGGSSVDSVARFYKNFGAKDCVYLHVKKNNLPKFVKWVKSLKS